MFSLSAFQTSKADKRKSGSTASSQDRDSLQEITGSPSSTSGRSIAGGVSAAVHALSPSRLRLEHPKPGASTFKEGKLGQKPVLPADFGEHPRAAPTPPARRGSTAPPESWWGGNAKSSTSPTTPGATVSLAPSPAPIEPVKESPPPPIPAKPPKRQKSKTTRDAADIFRSLEQDPFGGGGSPRTSSRSKRKTKDVKKTEPVKQPEPVKVEQKQPFRSFTEPVEVAKPMAIEIPIRMLHARAKSAAADDRAAVEQTLTPSNVRTRLAGVRGGRVDKSIKRLSTGSTIRAEGVNLEDLTTFLRSSTPPSRGEELNGSNPSQEQQLQSRRDRHGETLSMLLRDGFFQAGSLPTAKIDNSRAVGAVPAPLTLVNKALPPTPTSISTTPTDLHPVKPVRPLRPTVRNSRKTPSKRRSPLSQVSTTNSRRNNSKSFPSPSSLRLPAIPESLPPSLENTPPQSGSSTPTPIATQIHLRGGSVVTGCPPELTAWQRSVYIQGPIKLPKPVIIPGKDSVASLEPFQEVIDQVYQDALSIPRRRSDEQAVDDVCGFFDDFGFGDIGFEGDRFDVMVWSQHDFAADGLNDAEGLVGYDIERFSTPPTEPEATPVETVIAKGIMGTTSKPLPTQTPPINTTDAIRTRGGSVGRLTAQLKRKDSHTLSPTSGDGQLQLLPVPEDSMLTTVLEPSRADSRSGSSILTAKPGDRNSSGSDSIEELDGTSSWIAPLIPRKVGLLAGAVHANIGGR